MELIEYNEKHRLTPEHLYQIHNVLDKGDRVEIIPTKDGIKIMRVRRNTIKTY